MSYLPYSEDFIHKYTRRKRGHDYYSPCRYHIILKKAVTSPDFGKLIGSPLIPFRQLGCAEIEHSKLGKIINGNIFSLPQKHKILKINQYCVMPNHVHIFLRVLEKSEYHLGYYIGKLKANIKDEYSRYLGREIKDTDIFEENYTDKIIYWGSNFNTIYEYIRLNPHRLAIIRMYPHFFQRIFILKFEGIEYEAYGNPYLLKNPFKKAVKCSRKKTFQENLEIEDESLEHVAEGGVLLSTFVNKAERRIREKTELMHGKYIRFQAEPFPEKFKPSREFFDYCTQGKLLLIAPKENIGGFGYEANSLLNKLAMKIANGDFDKEIDALDFTLNSYKA